MPKNVGDNLEEGFEQEEKLEQETEQNFENTSQNVEGNTKEETINNAQTELQKQFDVFQMIGNESASRIVQVERNDNADAFLKAKFAELKTSVTKLSIAPAEKKEEAANQIADTVNELQNLDNQQKVIGDSSFQLLKKHKKGVGFGSWLLRGIGLPIAGILGVVAGLCSGIGAIGYSIYNKIKWSGKLKNAQESMKKGLPGLGVEDNLEREDVSALGDDQDILDDIRRIPLIWERAIPENPEQKPYLLVRAKKWEGFDPGHVFLSLCYSRMNPLKNKMERYHAQFGFYPKGRGIESLARTLNQAQTSAVIPGALQDDKNHVYDISKKYVVNNKQINKILTESETYETNGYNLIKRNCATFVAEVTKNAGVGTESIFNEDTFQLMDPLWIADKAGIGRRMLPFANQAVKNELMKETQEDDFTYNRFGQKKVTQEEVKRMEQTAKAISLVGYSPNGVADAMEEEGISLLDIKDEYTDIDSLVESYKEHQTEFTISMKALSQKELEGVKAWNEFVCSELMPEGDRFLDNMLEEKPPYLPKKNPTPENYQKANESIESLKKNLSQFYIRNFSKDKEVRSAVYIY